MQFIYATTFVLNFVAWFFYSIFIGYTSIFLCIFTGQFNFQFFVFILICLVSHICGKTFSYMLASAGLWFCSSFDSHFCYMSEPFTGIGQK